MDDDARQAAKRLNTAAERVQIGMAIVVALLIAASIWLAFLYYLLSHILPGEQAD